MPRFDMIISVAIVLAACQPMSTASTSSPAGPIATSAAFNEMVVGRRLSLGDGYVTANADGTLVGNFNGAPLLGTWAFRDGRFCRTLTQTATDAPVEDCQTFVANADGTFDVVRTDGTRFTYQVG